MNHDICPCGSREMFVSCCQPLLTGEGTARTPEQLMRSRYSAFATGNAAYLIATRHPSQQTPDDENRIAQTIQETDWLSLRVLDSSRVTGSSQKGFVEFVAFYRDKQFSTEAGLVDGDSLREPGQLHEKSEFVKEDGKWFYIQGVSLPPIKVARNDPCWCGSGKKFKQCHARGK